MAKENHTGQKLAIGALIAGAAGYIAGILTAPKSGKQTRDDIASKADEVKLEAEAQLKQAHDELDQLIKDTKTKTIALSAQAREEFNETVVKAKDAKDKASTVLKALKSGEAQDPELSKAIKQAKLAGKNLGKYLKS